jgi:SAM-dependent methyltransferase
MIRPSKDNMEFFNTSFYDKASADYSAKRYSSRPRSFIQFLFQKRLKHVLYLIEKHMRQNGGTLIEDGCADGIVAQTVGKEYPHLFSKILGTDISPGMIQAAREMNKNSAISFALKSEVTRDVKADAFLAVGFVSPGIFEDEFSFIKSHLAEDGIVIVSLASRNSPYAKLKLATQEITGDYWTFKKYEEFLKKDFEIVDSVPYGLFVPKLWALPAIGRAVQPILEVVLGPFRVLFHETLYVLKYKR